MDDLLRDIARFLEIGGDVLLLIMGAAFLLWLLIAERYWYFWFQHPRVVRETLDKWHARSDHSSWYAHQVRNQLISTVDISTRQWVDFIKTLVAVAPLFGLLGTVTGMIEVFDVLASLGSSNPRAMAAGVSKATIPTMSGLVVAISGLYFSVRLDRRARDEVQHVADQMELH